MSPYGPQMTSTHLTPCMESPITEVGHWPQCHNLGISPIPLDVSLTNLLASGLVKGWAKFLYDLTKSKNITPLSMSCLTILCLRLRGHAIFGVMLVSDTCRTTERVRRVGFWCPMVSLFFFLLLQHNSDASDMPIVKKKKSQILTGGLTNNIDFVITLKQ